MLTYERLTQREIDFFASLQHLIGGKEGSLLLH